MKHFVYLDTDVLNSYLSQISGGLLKSSKAEISDTIVTGEIEELKQGSEKIKGNFGLASFLGLTYEEENDVINTTNTLSQTETGRELIEKILHDNALDEFQKHLKTEGILKDSTCEDIGSYIGFEDKFLVRDIDLLLNTLTDRFKEFYKYKFNVDIMTSLDIDKYIKENNLTNIAEDIKRRYHNPDNTDKFIENEFYIYEIIKEILDLAKSVMPFSKFIVCNNCLIPLQDKYLRETVNNIRFVYSGNLNVLGRYTSGLGDSFKKEIYNMYNFNGFATCIDELLEMVYINILGLDKSMKIVIPIALYFE